MGGPDWADWLVFLSTLARALAGFVALAVGTPEGGSPFNGLCSQTKYRFGLYFPQACTGIYMQQALNGGMPRNINPSPRQSSCHGIRIHVTILMRIFYSDRNERP